MEALKEWDQRATPEGRKKLENLALTAKVKARILPIRKFLSPPWRFLMMEKLLS